MKIDASKNHPADKKDTKNVYKTETSVFNTQDSLKPSANAPAPGAFAKILEETRRQNEKENATAAKTDSAEQDSKTSRSERDEKIGRATDEKKELEERNSREGDSDAGQNGDESHSQAAAITALQATAASASEIPAPAARSILHVADLERIVATIRTETFQNQKQVTIALKNSVLQGLQIKLTIDENGKLKAEFLAAGKHIKKQLEQRKKELSEILHNRSALFSEIEITSQE